MIRNDVDRVSGAFEVVPPGAEGLEDSEELFVMSIVVELRGLKCPGEKTLPEFQYFNPVKGLEIYSILLIIFRIFSPL